MLCIRLVIFAIAAVGLCRAQDFGLNLKQQTSFLDLVAPIITEGEVEIYQSLPSAEAKEYFRAIFWHKRDPQPETTANAYKRRFYERRSEADVRFGEEGKQGSRSDRGQIYQLLGEPDDVVQKELVQATAFKAWEEIWRYEEPDASFRFVYDGRNPGYRLDKGPRVEALLAELRNAQVLDRAEPYALRPQLLTLPNLGFTKDIENLASVDKFELKHRVSYSFFRGGQNQTEMMISLTTFDASERSLDVHLAAYDPYDIKVLDFKKLIEPRNGSQEDFFVAIEPDQYRLVLRLKDRDGRESINRRVVDVPQIGGAGLASSSLITGRGLAAVPLQGFLEPKKFVFGSQYFVAAHDFSGFGGKRVYFMQLFYNLPGAPKPRFFIDGAEVEARLEVSEETDDATRVVYSAPLPGSPSDSLLASSVYEDAAGNLVHANVPLYFSDKEPEPSRMLSEAAESDRIRMVHPAHNDAGKLDRVVAAAEEGVSIRAMYVFLNGRLFLQRDKAPWEVNFPKDSFSVSGQNELVLVLDTDQGLFKQVKKLEPLRVDERIKSRLVQVYFNAFTEEEGGFLNELSFDELRVEVDGQPYKPKEVMKVEEPITFCFMVDTSYSMKDSFSGNLVALRSFIESMRPQDSGYFVEFNNEYVQYLNATRSKSVLLAALGGLDLAGLNPKFADKIYEENETYIYDAVIAAVHSLIQVPGRRVIVLVSDGIGREGEYHRNGMLTYARENNVVVYSLWVNNNPGLSKDEMEFLQKEMSRAEKFFRKVGLSRFFAKKDERKNRISQKVRNQSITEGVLEILSEESGGFHYPVFKTDRTLIREYVEHIENAVQAQFVMSLNLPISSKKQHVDIYSLDPKVLIRNKSEVMVSKTNPLVE